jgi:hypothetical protein
VGHKNIFKFWQEAQNLDAFFKKVPLVDVTKVASDSA